MAPEEPVTGRLLWQVTTKWRAAVDRALAPLGLTHAQFALLGSLYGLSSRDSRRDSRPSQRELADFAGLEPIYVSKLTRTLEANGLLSRAEHPSDSRARQLALTARGTQVVREAVTIVHRLQDELTAPIGGSGGARNRELVRTLKALLGTGEDSEERSETMTQTLTGQDIGEAQGAVSGLLDKTLENTGVTSQEYIALRVLQFRGPWESPADLHAFLTGQPQLGLDAAATDALLRGLEERGLATDVSLDAPGPSRLTDEGAALHTRLAEEVQRTTQRLYADFDAGELAIAHRVLNRVTERANALRNS